MSEEKKLTQADINRIIQERLRRERAKADKEQEEVEDEREPDTPDYKAIYFDKLKHLHLLKAGIAVNQVERYKRYIDDGKPEEVAKQAEELAGDLKEASAEKKSNESSTVRGISFK